MYKERFLLSEFFAEKKYRFLEDIAINNSFLPAKKIDNLIFVSSATPLRFDDSEIVGKIGGEVTVETAKEAACLCLVHSLSLLEFSIGQSLTNKTIQAADFTFMLNTTPEFEKHSEVVDMASDLFIDALGERGQHSRSAIGVNSLVRNVSMVLKGVYKVRF